MVDSSNKEGCYKALCPNCDDSSGHLEVDMKKHLFYCVRCGNGGRIFGGLFREERGMPVEHHEAKPLKRFEQEFYKPARLRNGSVEENFLRGRGFNDTLLKKLDPHRNGPQPERVYFPIRDHYGNIVTWVGRSMYPSVRPKWQYSKGSTAKDHLWGLNSHGYEEDEIILVEGIFDAVWDDKRVAMFGSSLSDEQLSMLVSFQPKSIIVALDEDKYVESLKIACDIALAFTCDVYTVKLPEGKDPHDLGHNGAEYIEYNKRSLL